MSEHPMIVDPAAEESPSDGRWPRGWPRSWARASRSSTTRSTTRIASSTRWPRSWSATTGWAGIERYRKVSASVPTPPETLSRLLAASDAAVHGVAD